MFFSRIQVFIVSIAINALLPLGLVAANCACLLFGGPWALSLALALGVYILYEAGPWEFGWFYLRYLVLAASAILFALSLAAAPRIAMDLATLASAACLAAEAFVVAGIMAAKLGSAPAVSLEFPFRDGLFVITDGGDGSKSRLMNYHYGSGVHKSKGTTAAMQFAVDIAKLGRSGFTTSSLLRPDNGTYEIYGVPLRAPASGEVIAVYDELEDNEPFSRKYPYSVGNHIAIRSGDYVVLMGHLIKGSILVKAGDAVVSGQEIARIGNSGLTPRPHLHMQVSEYSANLWSGKGVLFSFGGRRPNKNSLIAAPSSARDADAREEGEGV